MKPTLPKIVAFRLPRYLTAIEMARGILFNFRPFIAHSSYDGAVEVAGKAWIQSA